MSAQKKDPVQKIRELYEEDTRRVPYPVFMRCFDALLEDPPDPTPAPPSEDLKPYFRAVCMAVDLGIADQQDRGEDRREEFCEHILPVWEKELPEAEFEVFRELLSGKVRKRMERMRRGEHRREAEKHRSELEEASGDATRKRDDRFQRAVQDASPETIHPEEPSPGGEEPEDREGMGSGTITLDQDNRIPSGDSVQDILRAIEAGEIPIQYGSSKARIPFAEYSCRGRLITILLLQKKGNYFVLVEADQPTRETSGAPDVLRRMAEDMSYNRTGPCAFERTIGDASIKIRLGRNGTYVACRRPHKLRGEELAQTVEHLHKNMNRFLTALHNRDSGDDDE